MELTKLKELRKMRGVTIGQLSKATKLNRDRISLIERGMVNPSYQTVLLIIEALDAKLTITI